MAQAADQVVYRDSAGRTLTLEDLKKADGNVKWELRGGKPVPPEAQRLHDLGRTAGQKGEYAKALASFEQAAKLAPDWPYPKYDAAYTYLLQKNFAKAYELYQQVDALSPRGFFTAKTAVHVLGRERAGKFPEGTYLAFLSLEWADSVAEKRKLAQVIARDVPQASISWYGLLGTEEKLAARLALIDKGLAADGDAETLGFLKINKALVLEQQGRRKEAVDMLGVLALDPAAPLDIEMLSRQSLKFILAR